MPIWSNLLPLWRRLTMWCGVVDATLHRITAPHSRREDAARREYILNVLLLILISVVLILFITTAYLQVRLGPGRGGVSLVSIATIEFGFCLLYWLSRRGHHYVATYGLLLVFLLPTVYSVYHWGTLLVMPLLGGALIIILTSTLLGTRHGAILTALMIGALAWLQHRVSSGQLHPDIRWLENPVRETYTIQLGIILAAIMFITWLAERQIESSLRRARRSEKQVLQERDRLEARVEERTLQLKRAQQESVHAVMQLAEFGRLSSGYFHDLVNPITAVSLNLELLEHQAADSPEMRTRIAAAHTATTQLIAFLRTIQRQLHNQPVHSAIDVGQEITQALDVLSHKIRLGQIQVTQSTAVSTPFYGNPLKFFQVVINLLSNAVDACSQNPSAAARSIHIEISSTADSFTLKVKDTGPGIDVSLRTRIFEPFITTKDEKTGTGLGLAIVRNIVEQEFHGTIVISDTGPHGTTFCVQLPQLTPH